MTNNIQQLTEQLWKQRALFAGDVAAFQSKAILEADVRSAIERGDFAATDYHGAVKHYEAIAFSEGE
jgi:hypothetical protein